MNVSDYDQLRDLFLATYSLPDTARQQHLDQCSWRLRHREAALI